MYCNANNTALLAIERLRSMQDVVADSADADTARHARRNDGKQRQSHGDARQQFGSSAYDPLPIQNVAGSFASEITAAAWSADAPAQSATAYVETFHLTQSGRHYQMVLSIVSTGKPQRYTASLSEDDLDQLLPRLKCEAG